MTQPGETVEETTETTPADATTTPPPPDETGLGPDDTLNDVEFAEIIAKKTGTFANTQVEETAEEEPAAEEAPTPDPDAPEETLEEAQQRAEDELPSDATQEEIDAARAEAADQFYVGRYKTREEAERGLSEKDATIQRLHQERDRARQELEQRPATEAAAEPTEIDRGAWTEWAQQQIDAIEDPAQAEALATRALEEGGYDGYEVFLTAWLESEDPRVRARATTFNNRVTMEMADMRARAAAEPIHRDNAVEDARIEARDARDILAARRPDFAEMEEKFADVAEGLDEETRTYLTNLAGQGVDGKMRAMEYLYLEAKSRTTESRARAQRVERQQRDLADESDKLAATVTTTEAVPTRTTLSETELKARKVVNARRREWGLELLPEE